MKNLELVELSAYEQFNINGGAIVRSIGATPGGTLAFHHAVVDFFVGIWNGVYGRE